MSLPKQTQSLLDSMTLKPEMARGLYAELLQRNDAPKPGDADLLRKVLDSLGLTMRDFEVDLAALATINEIEGRVDPVLSELRQRQQEALKAANAHHDESTRLAVERDREYGRLRSVALQLHQAVNRLDNELQLAKRLRRKHCRAFGELPATHEDETRGPTVTHGANAGYDTTKPEPPKAKQRLPVNRQPGEHVSDEERARRRPDLVKELANAPS